MKCKRIVSLILAVLVCLLAGCGHAEPENAPGTSSAKWNWEVGKASDRSFSNDLEVTFLQQKEETSTHISLVYELTNHSDQAYVFGSGFDLEIKEDGTWHKLEANPPLDFTAEARTCEPDSTQEVSTCRFPAELALSPGQYRLVITLWPCDSDGNYDSNEPVYACGKFSIK